MRFYLQHIKGILTLGTILISKESCKEGKSSVWLSSKSNGSSSTKKRGLDQFKNNIESNKCVVDIPRGGSVNALVEAIPYGILLN